MKNAPLISTGAKDPVQLNSAKIQAFGLFYMPIYGWFEVKIGNQEGALPNYNHSGRIKTSDAI